MIVFVLQMPVQIPVHHSTKPDHVAHSTRGSSCVAPRWEVDFSDDPEVREALQCPNCTGVYLPDLGGTGRWDRKHVKIVYHLESRPSFAVSWVWPKCTGCSTTWNSLSPEILLKLPDHAVSQLPFSPRQVKKHYEVVFGLTLEASADFDLVEYENSSAIMRKCEYNLKLLHERHRNNYHSHIKTWRRRSDPNNAILFDVFPEVSEWSGRAGVPTYQTLTDHFLHSFYALGSAGATESQYMYRTREMQSVVVDGISVSNDHTYDGAKNCNDKDVKMTWNCASSELVAACSIYCETDGKVDFIHAVEELLHRPGWKPSRNFTDTFPNDKDFWDFIWPFCEGRLGIFHWMKRIFSTLHHTHKDYHRAQAALSACIYKMNSQDVSNVKAAVKAGLLGIKKKFTEEDDFESYWESLVGSPRFLKQFRKYISTETYSVEEIIANLKKWQLDFLDIYDEKKGLYLRSGLTAKCIAEVSTKIAYLPCPGARAKKLRQRPGSKHNCAEQQMDRGEKVETLHAAQGDYGNGNCRPLFAQALALEGTVRYSNTRQQEADYHGHKTDDLCVQHHKPWLFQQANELARAANQPEPYPSHQPPALDNGERFFYAYFEQQQQRKAEPGWIEALPNLSSWVSCPCSKCSKRRLTCQCEPCTKSRIAANGSLSTEPIATKLAMVLEHGGELPHPMNGFN